MENGGYGIVYMGVFLGNFEHIEHFGFGGYCQVTVKVIHWFL